MKLDDASFDRLPLIMTQLGAFRFRGLSGGAISCICTSLVPSETGSWCDCTTVVFEVGSADNDV